MRDALRQTLRCRTPVTTVAIMADGTGFLWAGGSPGEPCPVNVCDARGKAVLKLTAHKRPVLRARFLGDGSVVSFSFDSHICRWTDDGRLVASNDCHLKHRADGFDVTAAGDLAVVGDYRGEVTEWRTADGSRAFAWQGDEQGLANWAVAIEPNGKRLLTGGADGKVRVWG